MLIYKGVSSYIKVATQMRFGVFPPKEKEKEKKEAAPCLLFCEEALP